MFELSHGVYSKIRLIMRIKITLTSDKSGIIDFNYQHQIQAVIYGFLYRSNPDYGQWLHQQGFIYKKDKRFKLFVFSGILFNGKIKVISSNRLDNQNSRNGFLFDGSANSPFTFSFQIASPVDKFIQHLIDGIFREGNEITLGRQQVVVDRVETLPDPIAFNSKIPNPKSEILLKPLESPIFIKKPMPAGQQDIYLFPGDAGYEDLLNQNLVHKYETLHGKPYEGEFLKFDFQLERLKRFNRFEHHKPKLVKSFKVFKEGKIIGEIKGTLQPFTVTGTRELIRIGLECGFGQNNSMGCGYVEMNTNRQDGQNSMV